MISTLWISFLLPSFFLLYCPMFSFHFLNRILYNKLSFPTILNFHFSLYIFLYFYPVFSSAFHFYIFPTSGFLTFHISISFHSFNCPVFYIFTVFHPTSALIFTFSRFTTAAACLKQNILSFLSAYLLRSSLLQSPLSPQTSLLPEAGIPPAFFCCMQGKEHTLSYDPFPCMSDHSVICGQDQ